MIKTLKFECGAVLSREMDQRRSGYKATGDIRNVDIKKNGGNKLDGIQMKNSWEGVETRED